MFSGVYQLAACVYRRIASLPSYAAKSEFKGLSPCQNDQSPFFPTAQMIDCIMTCRNHRKLLLLGVAILLHCHFEYT